jgi:two-component system sensor histidine kinase HydH
MNQRIHPNKMPEGTKSSNTKLIAAIILILGVLLLTSAILDIYASRKELIHILEEQSKAMLTAIKEGSENAIESYELVEDIVAERLLDNARLLEELDFKDLLTRKKIIDIAEKNDIFRINIFDKNGERELDSFSGPGHGGRSTAPPDLLQRIEGNEELVMGFRQGRFSSGRRFAVAKRRRRGGVIVLNIDAREMLDFRRSVGVGKLIRDIGENDGIAYIAIQDTGQIYIATAGLDSLPSFDSDLFIQNVIKDQNPATRFTIFGNAKIFEIVYPYDVNNKQVLRMGLSTGHISEAERNAYVRAIITSLLLLIVGGVFASWIIGRQNYNMLRDAYERIETYTGAILSNMTDAVVAVDENHRLSVINQAAAKIFDVDIEKSIGVECSTVFSDLCPYLTEALQTGRGKFYSDRSLLVAQKRFETMINVDVLKNENGDIDTAFAVVKDITEQKKLQENLKRRDRITAMGHLASGVAHEIRNPLNAISMIAQRFKREFTPQSEKTEYDQLASTLVNESGRINEIVGQFLQFARPSELNKKPTNVSELLRDTVTLIEHEATKKGIEIVQRCEAVPPIPVDGDKLKQVFLNLGQNSVDACVAGQKIEFICHDDEHTIVIQIRDNGKGISSKDLDKIFNIYFTTKEEGTGIGLSIAQQIVSQHNGTIEVRSEENRETIFTINLPKTE